MPNGRPGGGGGGGGGILGVGNSFTGGSEQLELIGNHGYAYSGGVTVNDSDVTLLSFKSGNFYFVAKFQPVLMDTITDDYEFKFTMAGTQIFSTFTNSYRDYSPYEEMEIIIPAYTIILIEGRNRTAGNDNSIGAILTGRIYR